MSNSGPAVPPLRAAESSRSERRDIDEGLTLLCIIVENYWLLYRQMRKPATPTSILGAVGALSIAAAALFLMTGHLAGGFSQLGRNDVFVSSEGRNVSSSMDNLFSAIGRQSALAADVVNKEPAPPTPIDPELAGACSHSRGIPIPEYRDGGSITPFNLSLAPVKNPHSTIYDVFMFNNEYALLEIRLIELWDVVDFFVLVESPFTQSGRPKPLNFKNNIARYARFMSKIIHIMPEANAHLHENSQRALAMKVLGDLPKDTLIVLSDLDEIPSCWTIYLLKHAAELPRDIYGLLEMPLHYYSYRWRAHWNDRREHIHGSTTAKVFYRSFLDGFPIENVAFAHHGGVHWIFPDAGWHCSYCFKPEKIIKKIEALAHQEYNHPPFTNMDHVVEHVRKGIDLFDRALSFRLQNNTDDAPYAIRLEPAKYKLFYPDVDADGASIVIPSGEALLLDEEPSQEHKA